MEWTCWQAAVAESEAHLPVDEEHVLNEQGHLLQLDQFLAAPSTLNDRPPISML